MLIPRETGETDECIGPGTVIPSAKQSAKRNRAAAEEKLCRGPERTVY